MRNVLLFISIFVLITSKLYAQKLDRWGPSEIEYDSLVPIFQINDSTLHINLTEINVYPEKIRKKRARYKRRYSKRYLRLEAKVKKVYPYAKLAGKKLKEYNQVYLDFKTERERKSYAKSIEKEIFAEFEGEIRKMKISEGRILIKLIDREAGINSYQIIKEFRGGFQAFFWQTIASVFGHDLKSEYDPKTEDQLIEYIVRNIEKDKAS